MTGWALLRRAIIAALRGKWTEILVVNFTVFIFSTAVLCCQIRAWRIIYEELCQLLTVYVPEDYIMENLLPFVSTFTVDMMHYHVTLKFPGYPGISYWNILLFDMSNYHNFGNKKLDVSNIKVLLINEIWHLHLILRSISLG